MDLSYIPKYLHFCHVKPEYSFNACSSFLLKFDNFPFFFYQRFQKTRKCSRFFEVHLRSLQNRIYVLLRMCEILFFYILLVSEEEDPEVAKEEELLKELKLLVERRERMEKFAEKRAKGGEYLQKKGLILPEGISDYSASVIFTIPELQIMHFLLEVTP